MSTKWTFVRVVYHEAPRGQAEGADRLVRLLQGRCTFVHKVDVCACSFCTKKDRKKNTLFTVFATQQNLHVFSHPDYTVGFGITPNLPKGSRALPPVGTSTPPQRLLFSSARKDTTRLGYLSRGTLDKRTNSCIHRRKCRNEPRQDL